MPRIGLGGPENSGLDSNAPVGDAGYATGWCVAHITQYQKTDPATDSYSVEVAIYDANENEIGSTGGAVSSADTVSVTSALPWTLEVTTGSVDDDPVTFAYADQTRNSYDQSYASNFGAYDSGDRNGDTGFAC